MKLISPKKFISSQIKTNLLFKTKDVKKRNRRDRKTHKAIIIIFEIHERNKKFTVTVQPKNVCKLESIDHLWLPFLEQPQYDIVAFAVIIFRYITL